MVASIPRDGRPGAFLVLVRLPDDVPPGPDAVVAHHVSPHLTQVTAPFHIQLTLSHFAMWTANLGIHESFAQKILRTTMDTACPP